MADHFSGPRAIADPASDIADLFVFPSPERPGHLVLVLNVFPAAAPGALFSDAIAYRFRIRPVAVATAGARPAFEVGPTEYTFTCTFAAPASSNGETLLQTGTCTMPTGEQIAFRVGEQGTEAHGLRVFAGLRLDPFFIDLRGVQATEKLRRLAFQPAGLNILEGQNVLSVVVEVDVARLLAAGSGPLFAVVGETLTTGSHPIRLERMGRPEIKNVVMSPKGFDTVNHDLEIRDLYNQEDPFHIAQSYAGAYRARLDANLAFLDSLDDKTDWPLDGDGSHPLTELLLADFLVVDVSKPYAEDSCFEIERALLRGSAHATCGGRSLNDDIVDSLYTLLVNAGNGPRIRDGVDQATVPATRYFPFMVSPNPNPSDLKAMVAAQAASAKGGAQ